MTGWDEHGHARATGLETALNMARAAAAEITVNGTTALRAATEWAREA